MASTARTPQPTSFPLGDEEGEGRAAKRQHRQSNITGDDQPLKGINNPLISRPSLDSDTRQSMANRRRSVLRDHRAPLGPRPPDFANSKRITSESVGLQQPSGHRAFLPTTTSEPFLGLSARRTTTNFDFGSAGTPTSDKRVPSNRISSINASPLRSGRTESNTRGENTRPLPPTIRIGTQKQEGRGVLPTDNLGRLQAGSGRSGIRPENAALRAAQMSTAAARAPSATPLSLRTRRLSQFPPSATQQVPAPQSRKSLAPGTFPPGNAYNTNAESAMKPLEPRKTFVNESTPVRKISNPRARPRVSLDPISTRISPVKIQNDEAETTPTVQSVVLVTSPMLPEPKVLPSSSFVAKPRTQELVENAGSTLTDTSPNGTSRKQHHGLSRTVSPTDIRKAKRSSTVFQVPPLPSRSPTPELTFGSRHIRELPPAYVKDGSPPSSRTTPEQNVRFSGGRSLSSRSSFGSLRPSSSSWQQPSGQNFKSTDARLKISMPNDPIDVEKVPPVPAIPKVYESPNQTLDEPFFESLESQPSCETVAKNNINVTHETAVVDDKAIHSRDSKFLRRFTLGSRADQNKTNTTSAPTRQAGQAARLPPLKLGPLSVETADKIAAFVREPSSGISPKSTPPPRYSKSRPPSTPLTASRATFPTFDQIPDIGQHPLPNYQRSASSTQHHEVNLGPTAASRANLSTRLLTPSPAYGMPSVPVTRSSSKANVLDWEPSDGETVNTAQQSSANDTVQGPKLPVQPDRLDTVVPKAEKAFDELDSPADVRVGAAPTPTRRRTGVGFRRSSSKASKDLQRDRAGIADPVKDAISMPPPKLPASRLWTEPIPLSKSISMHKSSDSKSTGNATPGSRSSTNSSKPIQQEGHHTVSAGAPNTVSSSDRNALLQTSSHRLLFSRTPTLSERQQFTPVQVDPDESAAEDEMKKLASKRKEFEEAALEVEDLQRRARPKERVSPGQATRAAQLNIFERGEIIDYNDVYFCGTKGAKKLVGDLGAHSANFGYDDDRGDYNIIEGDHLAYRYEVVDLLGKGSFGQVVRCIDHKTGRLVAVKIIRNKKRFHQQALVEVNILQRLREWDPHNQHCMLKFTESFYFRGHLCIASELLGINLYEFIKAHDFRGFSLKLVRRFAKQMLSCLSLLQGRKVIHCDLKPENILLVHPLRSEIKTIDFGSSCFEHEKVYTYIQSRFYRSPEVILGMDYGMPIDMWSIGCILAELYTGYPIFPGENEQEQLACIMEIFGPPEKHLIERSTRKKVFFDSLGKPRVTVSSKGKRRRPSSKTLQQAIKCDDEPFLDFLTKCLRWDPDRRIKPDEALAHDFVTGPKTRSRASMAASPAKKPLSLSRTPSRSRPLPDLPAFTTKKPVNGISSTSPIKSSLPPRRQSTMNVISAGMKRNSNGATIGSALPRSVSGKPDLAAAAALHSLRQK